MTVTIRPATAADETALSRIDQDTWSPYVSPAVYTGRSFFAGAAPDQVLVAEVEEQVAGYVAIRPATQLPSNAHVFWMFLAVSPSAQRRGVASRLIGAAERFAVQRGGSKLSLRVLGVNSGARALYEKLGYVVEGVLRGEFRLPIGPGVDEIPVDDVLMAKQLSAPTN